MSKKLFPVIHCQNWQQTKANLQIANDAGVDGVFLINHRIPHPFLTALAERSLDAFPDMFIGVNYLDLDPIMALSVLPAGASALWSDNPNLIEDPMMGIQRDAQMFLDYREAKQSHISFYGSVAFKYQSPVRDLALITKIAKDYVDIVTTSGDATGKPAPVSKIKAMKTILGDKSLALASGVTASNVKDYLPFVDDFLVATGISKDFNNLDAVKVKELLDIIHAYQ